MEGLNYDIMEMVGHEVQIVRETAQNKANYQKVMDDVNSMLENIGGAVDLDDRNFSITDIFMNCYCLDDPAPFIPDRMYQLPDDEHPDDYWGGPTCIIHPDHD
mgnify:FL=1|tara:strand:- start:937 stop:1245 length:309 start_codon:yes stop_codon:yes gene_type:complete